MVVSKEQKDAKRKRKEPIIESPEMPKRTKVQAQRKFAQGQHAPSSSTYSFPGGVGGGVSGSSGSGVLAASTSTQSIAGGSMIRDNREPPPELISKRPKPEDFLTFLCFRGTPVLPTKLDFLNQNKNKNSTTTKKTDSTNESNEVLVKKNDSPKTRASTSRIQQKKTPTTTITSLSTTIIPSSDKNLDNCTEKNLNIKDNNIKTPKRNDILPFAVRKRAEQSTEGNKTIMKKTNKNKGKSITPVKEENGRRSTRTRGKTSLGSEFNGDDDDDDNVDSVKNNDEKELISTTLPLIDSLNESSKIENSIKEKPSTVKGKRKTAISGQKLNQEIKNNSDDDNVGDSGQKKDIESININTRLIEQQLPNNKKNPGKRGPKPKINKNEIVPVIPDVEIEPEPVGRMTRQRAFFEPVKVPPKPDETEITKIHCDEIKESDKNNITLNNDQIDFSSEDEQPLAKTIKLTNVKKSPKKLLTKTVNNKKLTATTNSNIKKSKILIDDDIAEQSLPEIGDTFELAPNDDNKKSSKKKITPNREVPTITTDNKLPSSPEVVKAVTKQCKLTTTLETDIQIETTSRKSDVGSSKLTTTKSKKNITKKLSPSITTTKLIDKNKNHESEEDNSFGNITTTTTTKLTPKKKKTRKKQGTNTTADTADISQQSQTDISETDIRTCTGRPTRKTKEAATIYMELIGQKLNLGDFDEDDFSMDSFPELPNVKETQKMETELKKNVGKPKPSLPPPTPTPTQMIKIDKETKEEIIPLITGDIINVRQSITDESINQVSLKMGKKRGPKKKLTTTNVIPLKKLPVTNRIDEKKKPKKKKKINKNQQDVKSDIEDDDDIVDNKDSKRKFEKSFSDSDDEPLAIKLTKTSEKDYELSKKSESINFSQQNLSSHFTASNLTTIPIQIQSVMTPTTALTLSKQNIIDNMKFTTSQQITSTPNQFDNKLQQQKQDERQLKLITPPNFVQTTVTTKSQILRTPQNTNIVQSGQLLQQHQQQQQQQHIHHTPKHHTPPTAFTPLETYPSPKINPTFLTPKFDRNLERRLPTTLDTQQQQLAQKNLSFPSPSVQASITTPLTTGKLQESTTNTPKSTSPSNNSSANAIANILATNLMPSKEESGKIFGIASVSLAQSSGPDNTKCTLGKCGSIHKPVLGPVVPTETYLGEQQLSSKERRKAKVNMTHEQIQKWLIECSSNPDDIQDDLDDDFDDILKPTTFAPTPPPPPIPIKDDKESTSTSSRTTTNKQDLGKAESAWSGKGPSLKATPVIAKDEICKFDESTVQQDLVNKKDDIVAVTPPPLQLQPPQSAIQTTDATTTATTTAAAKKLQTNLTKKEKKKLEQEIKLKEKKDMATALKKDTIKLRQSPVKETAILKSPKASTSQANLLKTQKKNQQQLATEQQNKNKNDNTVQSQSLKTPPKRQPVYSSKGNVTGVVSTAGVGTTTTTTTNAEIKRTIQKMNTSGGGGVDIGNSFSAFSPDNEKSVYSFDKEEEDVLPLPLSKPFRRQSRRESHNDDQSLSDTKPLNKQDKKLDNNSSISMTLSPDDNRKLGKMNFDTISTTDTKKFGGKKSTTTAKSTIKNTSNDDKSTTNEFVLNDSEGETFYIPLQGASVGVATGGKSDLLQAVEVKVKVGREGPDGPNQRVCVQATLVTKSQISTTNSTTTTANAAINDTNDKYKDSSNGGAITTSASAKNVPIGTVQPRFKTSNAAVDQQQNTSGSTSVVAITAATTSVPLTRVNSNSSLFSGSGKSRTGGGGNSTSNSKKHKDDTVIKMCNNTAFPRHDDPSQMVEAPVFRPTEKEFHDPIEFIERITPIAARFGICKIIPPASFKPECRVSDDMRFSAYNQYVHKMLHRWGPNVKEFHAIKKHCGTQRVSLTPFPLIGQMEVDLPRLYHTVQELGGLQEVMEKKKWTRVADEMCIPKLAQDRASRLDDIYCKYLLPYDTLSTVERQKLFDEVEADWAKREARARRNADHCLNSDSDSNDDDDDEDEIESSEDSDDDDADGGVSMECIVKGKNMPLKQFFRIARNTMSLWFKNTEPNVGDVEAEFWRHVAVRDSHVCVHSGSIDSSGWGYGFPSPGPKGKGSPCAKHPWNLKVLTNNPGSVLRSLGPVMGVTVPTLHVGMLFSACCWYRDPHGLSWIEYLHTGASKIWYGIPDEQSSNFRTALTALIPTHCQNKTIWLPCDTAMVPPHMLTDRGVSLCRIEQKPGEFVVIFPRAYTSSLSSGYVVSESVYFATTSWLDLAKEDFKDIHDSCEPAMFSLEQLLFAIASDQRVTVDILAQCLPMIYEVFEKEQAAREQLKATGVKSIEKLSMDKQNKTKKKPTIPQFTEEDNECDLCRANLYISMVKTNDGNNIYCLQHALKNLNKGNILSDQCKLIYTYSIEDIEELIKKLKERLAHKNKSTFAFSSSSAGGGGTGKKK